jgi:hypothetical protein
MRKVREITFEVERKWVNFGRQNTLASFCGACAENSRLIGFGEAFEIFNGSIMEFHALLDKKEIHVMTRSDGSAALCVNSLLLHRKTVNVSSPNFDETQPLGIPKPAHNSLP